MKIAGLVLALIILGTTSCVIRPPDAPASDNMTILLDDVFALDALRMFNALYFGNPNPRFTTDSLTEAELDKYHVTLDVQDMDPTEAFQVILREAGLSGEITSDGQLRVQKGQRSANNSQDGTSL